MKYHKKDLEKSFREGFDLGVSVCHIHHYYNPLVSTLYNLRNDLMFKKNHKGLIRTAECYAEIGVRTLKDFYKKRSEIEGDHSKTFLRSSGILKKVDQAIEELKSAHKSLCYELATQKPWGRE